jgi:hypothetical protein
MDKKSRVKLEECGKLGIWIYIDDKLMDLIHLSDLQKVVGLKESTKDAIESIYDDIVLEGEEE